MSAHWALSPLALNPVSALFEMESRIRISTSRSRWHFRLNRPADQQPAENVEIDLVYVCGFRSGDPKTKSKKNNISKRSLQEKIVRSEKKTREKQMTAKVKKKKQNVRRRATKNIEIYHSLKSKMTRRKRFFASIFPFRSFFSPIHTHTHAHIVFSIYICFFVVVPFILSFFRISSFEFALVVWSPEKIYSLYI